MESIIINTYIIGKEDTVIFILVDWVDPGVADEVDSSLPRDSLQGQWFEEELGMVAVLDDDRPWNALALIPIEGYVESGLAGS